ncbi:putative transmembrane ascorbate-dependent reductase CYB561 homolog [Symsagittifera roscoffensis]|uniref:putative transmembrane ascorbate-dependent reductase CYB561 homolog n=1 Tax=Symsagittifera roscoffensis TaxID=84072 RepID=UPI00307C33F6
MPEQRNDMTSAETFVGGNRLMIVLVILAEVCGIISLVLLVDWLNEYYEGYSFDKDDSALFSYHPIFMYIGMIFLFGNSNIVFRFTRTIQIPKLIVKLLHGFVHALAILFICLGTYTVARRKIVFGNNPMYSSHSWYGAATIALFFIQYAFGVVAFVTPVLSESVKAKMLPLHRFLGAATFILAFVTVMTGLTRINSFVERTTGKRYTEYPAWGTISNFFAVFTGVFVLLVMILVTNPAFKRQANKASSYKDEKVETQF